MDFQKLSGDITTWIKDNRIMAVAIGIAIAGTVFYLVKTNSNSNKAVKGLNGYNKRSGRIRIEGLK